jgi:hypothetical protein
VCKRVYFDGTGNTTVSTSVYFFFIYDVFNDAVSGSSNDTTINGFKGIYIRRKRCCLQHLPGGTEVVHENLKMAGLRAEI